MLALFVRLDLLNYSMDFNAVFINRKSDLFIYIARMVVVHGAAPFWEDSLLHKLEVIEFWSRRFIMNLELTRFKINSNDENTKKLTIDTIFR